MTEHFYSILYIASIPRSHVFPVLFPSHGAPHKLSMVCWCQGNETIVLLIDKNWVLCITKFYNKMTASKLHTQVELNIDDSHYDKYNKHLSVPQKWTPFSDINTIICTDKQYGAISSLMGRETLIQNWHLMINKGNTVLFCSLNNKITPVSMLWP